MSTLTIPKKITKGEELIVLSRKEYERLSRLNKPRHARKETVTEEDVLRWSREAKTLKKLGKLPVLESLKEFRNIK